MLLVDTDVMIDVLRRHPPAIQWLSSLHGEELLLPGFVVMELVQGCRNRAEQSAILTALRPYRIEWPSSEACQAALDHFAAYRLSSGIGIIDALIGHLAVELNVPLLTFNQRHYQPIVGLEIRAPYART